MKIGIIGLSQTGKTTLFNLLCGRVAGDVAGAGGLAASAPASVKGHKKAANFGIGLVPDGRIDFLSALYKPKKTTFANIEYTDIAGFSLSSPAIGMDGFSDANIEGAANMGSGGGGGNSRGSSGAGGSSASGAAKFLNDVRPCDALIHVVRAFDSETVIHDLATVNPARDFESVDTELLFADLEMIENRISRINASKKISKIQTDEIALLKRCYAQIENGGAIRDIELSEEEAAAIRGYSFLTEKPRIAVANMDERQWESGTYHHRDELNALCTASNIPLIELCADMELEISRLAEDDKKLFMEDMGIEQPGVAILARAIYRLLGLISFLTVGEDEVRAWTVEEGSSAKRAAGKIHSDIERGFIRAEVVKYDALKELGSMAKVKEHGLFRLEGKEYIVADGDIISFRFNV